MNLKADLSIKNQELLKEIEYKIEDKEYSIEEIKQCECYVANHIMSLSSKNGDIARETIRFNDLMNVLVKNEE